MTMRVPQEKALAIFANIAELQEKHRQMAETMDELTRSILHHNHKEDLLVDFTDDKTVKLLRYYHQAIEAGRDRFDFEGVTLLVAYAKYLIEHLEGQWRDTHPFVTTRMNAECYQHKLRMAGKERN